MRSASTALSLGIALAAFDSAQAQQPFDGRWNVQAVTRQGACSRAYRYPVVVRGGQIRSAGPEGADVLGIVTPQGDVQGRAASNRLRVDVAGRLTGRAGTGTGNLVGVRRCSGSWRAQRQG